VEWLVDCKKGRLIDRREVTKLVARRAGCLCENDPCAHEEQVCVPDEPALQPTNFACKLCRDSRVQMSVRGDIHSSPLHTAP